MTVFCFKPITPTERLGTRLKEAREASDFSILDLSLKTHVPVPHLEAIEAGAFKKLPAAAVFRRAYVKEYAAAVGLSSDECITQLIHEAGLSNTAQTHPKRHITFFPFATVSIAARNVLLIGVGFVFAGYLLWQINGVLQPPRLALFSPLEGEVLNGLVTTIEGQTEPEVALSINGQDLMVNEQGRFSTKIDLAPGLNTIVVAALKKHGKTTTVTRHVVVKNSAPNAPVSYISPAPKQ